MHIKIRKGINIPMKGAAPSDQIRSFSSQVVAYDFVPFTNLHLKLNVREGEEIKPGHVLAWDKKCPKRLFCSFYGGKIQEIRRGLKRRIHSIVIEKNEEKASFEKLSPSTDREKLLKELSARGLFPLIRKRPLDVLATPNKLPQAIFVQGLESAPLQPSCRIQIQPFFDDFKAGIAFLNQICSGEVHLIHHVSDREFFQEVESAQKHSAEGPHPIASPSIHIEHIRPITNRTDVLWTIHAHHVAMIGSVLAKGEYLSTKVIALAGESIPEDQRGIYQVSWGAHIASLLGWDDYPQSIRFISGDPLVGMKVTEEQFIGFFDRSLLAIPEMSEKREFMHFFRLGRHKYTASKTYLSGFFPRKDYSFTTDQHGEERAYVDPLIYHKVMPLKISPVHLIKAILAEDFEKAAELGLLEVSKEDFALPSFICPSKTEMSEIVGKALLEYDEQYLGD